MKKSARILIGYSLIAFLAACSAGPTMEAVASLPGVSSAPGATETASPEQAPAAAELLYSRAGLRALEMQPGPDGGLYLVAGANESLELIQLSSTGEELQSLAINPDRPALLSSVDPPAFVVDAQGQAHVVWVGLEEGLVWYARSQADGGFGPAMQVSQAEADHHAVMPVIALDGEGTITVVWLQGLSMQLAQSSDGGETFNQSQLDEEVCDCCRPAPRLVDGELYIAYRESQYDDGGRNYRDVHLGRYAEGQFEAWPAADEHWYLNVCPVAGPGFVVDGDQFALAWMDGRANQDGGLAQSDIWFASSPLDAPAFSANLRINQGEGVFNKPPALAQAEDGRLFVAWIAQAGAANTIYYASSADGGQSFSDPSPLYESNGPLTAPKTIALAHSGEHLYLAFIDLEGLKILQVSP